MLSSWQEPGEYKSWSFWTTWRSNEMGGNFLNIIFAYSATMCTSHWTQWGFLLSKHTKHWNFFFYLLVVELVSETAWFQKFHVHSYYFCSFSNPTSSFQIQSHNERNWRSEEREKECPLLRGKGGKSPSLCSSSQPPSMPFSPSFFSFQFWVFQLSLSDVSWLSLCSETHTRVDARQAAERKWRC